MSVFDFGGSGCRLAPSRSRFFVGGSLTMTIEQPDELQLFLRFEYTTTLPVSDDQDAVQTQEIVKSAYRENDIDTVRLIRQYVQAKQEPGSLH